MVRNRGILFYAYRYFLVHNGQQSLFEEQPSNECANKVQALVRECVDQKQLSFDILDRKHVLLFAKMLGKNTTLFKFSKDVPVTRYSFDEDSADIIESKDWPCQVMFAKRAPEK